MKATNPRRGAAAAVILASLLAVAVPALGAAGKGAAKARVSIQGRETIKPNSYLKIGFHFAPGTITVRSGATITIANQTRDPHTLSIVKPSQVPRTFAAIEHCAICETIAKSHGLSFEGPGPTGPPPHPLVDVGAPGFNTVGDSVVIGPKGLGGPVTFKVTAKPGTVLNFICIIHPWMDGRFLVK